MTLFLFRINLVELRLLVLRERLLVRKGLLLVERKVLRLQHYKLQLFKLQARLHPPHRLDWSHLQQLLLLLRGQRQGLPLEE